LTERPRFCARATPGRTVASADRLSSRGPNRLTSGAYNDTARLLATVSLAAADAEITDIDERNCYRLPEAPAG
jgi:hypothetical protein